MDNSQLKSSAHILFDLILDSLFMDLVLILINVGTVHHHCEKSSDLYVKAPKLFSFSKMSLRAIRRLQQQQELEAARRLEEEEELVSEEEEQRPQKAQNLFDLASYYCFPACRSQSINNNHCDHVAQRRW